MMVNRLVNLIAAASILAVTVAGCSTKKDATPQPAESPTSHGSLADCLGTHGVKDAGGQAVMMGPPAGVDQATWDQAMKACSTLAPGPAAP